MTFRGSDNQTITWDAENRLVSVSVNGTEIASFVYDGDGNRIKKLALSEVEGEQEVLYINKYYEINLTTGNETASYYLGNRLIAQREGTELRYIHQDHLTGTSLVSDENGEYFDNIKYGPYDSTRSCSIPTNNYFTGQSLCLNKIKKILTCK